MLDRQVLVSVVSSMWYLSATRFFLIENTYREHVFNEEVNMFACTRIVQGVSVTTNVNMVFYFADCSNKNLLCNAAAGAFLPAVTVCYQTLYV